MAHARIRIGGLFRCCIATCEEAMFAATELPKEGETLTCKHCKKTSMVYRDGAWQWSGEDG